MRKYAATARLAATGAIGDGPLFLLDCVLRFVRVAVLLSLWRTLLAGRPGEADVSLSSLLTYTLIAEVFAGPLSSRTDLLTALWDGSITRRFLQPAAVAGQFAAEMCGRWALPFFAVSLPLLLLAPALGVDPRPASLQSALFFVPSLVLAVSVGLAIEFVFGALIVALNQSVWTIEQIRAGVTTLLSGAIVPLALLPRGAAELFAWLPFASMASAPLRIYTGTGPIAELLLLQAAWSAALWSLASWMWRAYRERLCCHGG